MNSFKPCGPQPFTLNMKHDTMISAERIVTDAYLATDTAPDSDVHTRATVRPAAYPALESEVYASLDFITERETMMPPSSSEVQL